MPKKKPVLRKGRMTLEEIEVIKKNSEMPIEKLCKKLKRTKESVQNVLGVTDEPEVKVEPKKESYIKELFAKNLERGVVCATEASSMFMDSKKATRKPNLDQSFIHKFDKNK